MTEKKTLPAKSSSASCLPWSKGDIRARWGVIQIHKGAVFRCSSQLQNVRCSKAFFLLYLYQIFREMVEEVACDIHRIIRAVIVTFSLAVTIWAWAAAPVRATWKRTRHNASLRDFKTFDWLNQELDLPCSIRLWRSLRGYQSMNIDL